MSKNQGEMPLPDVMAQAVEADGPFAEGLGERFDRSSGPQLFHALLPTRCRDVLVRPPADLRKHERYVALRGHLRLALTWMYRKKMATGKVRPSLFRVLTSLRRWWSEKISSLPEVTARRLRHVWQVQLCPPLIARQLLGKVGLTFSASRGVALPPHPVALGAVRAQWLDFQVSRNWVVPMFREGRLSLTPSFELSLDPELTYDFSRLPAKNARGPRVMPLDRTASVENGIAAHEAVEAAVLSGVGLRTEVMLPPVYVGVETGSAGEGATKFLPDFWKKGEVTDALSRSAAEKLLAWYSCRRDGAAVRAQGPSPDVAEFVEPFGWLDVIEQRGLSARLPTDVTAEPAIREAFGDAYFDFLVGVWLADLRKYGRLTLYPLAHFSPGTDQRPVEESGRRLFIDFPAAMRGRDVYVGGRLERFPEAAAVQVIEPQEA